MITVWKFEVPWTGMDDFEIEMPKGAEILHFVTSSAQRTITVWARVDSNAEHEAVPLRIAGTGHPLQDSVGVHIGTYIDGALVWHLFHRYASAPQ